MSMIVVNCFTYLKWLLWSIFRLPLIADSVPSTSYKASMVAGVTPHFRYAATNTCAMRGNGLPLGFTYLYLDVPDKYNISAMIAAPKETKKPNVHFPESS